MIKLMSAMLAKNIRDLENGEAIFPFTAVAAHPDDRGGYLPLDCIALINLYDGQPDEVFILSASIRGPNVATVTMGSRTFIWPSDDPRVYAPHMIIRERVPIRDGGLYKMVFQLNGQPFLTLPFFVTWEPFDEDGEAAEIGNA